MPAFSKTTSASGGPESSPDPPEGWTAAERAALVAVARAALDAAVYGRLPEPPPADLPARLRQAGRRLRQLAPRERAAGVHRQRRPAGPLARTRRARGGGSGDTRSTLSSAHARGPTRPPRRDLRARAGASCSRPSRPTTHGLCIRLGDRGAVLLPQVAARHGWNRDTLLAELCGKAGLPPDAWRDAAALLLAFTIETIEAEV
jgi:hypothetical protein